MVPAWTMSPSLNFARAKSLASVSVSNILVARGLRGLADTPRFCTSKVTYQEYVIFSESFRTLRDVRLKSGMGTKTEVCPRSRNYGFTVWSSVERESQR